MLRTWCRQSTMGTSESNQLNSFKEALSNTESPQARAAWRNPPFLLRRLRPPERTCQTLTAHFSQLVEGGAAGKYTHNTGRQAPGLGCWGLGRHPDYQSPFVATNGHINRRFLPCLSEAKLVWRPSLQVIVSGLLSSKTPRKSGLDDPATEPSKV